MQRTEMCGTQTARGVGSKCQRSVGVRTVRESAPHLGSGVLGLREQVGFEERKHQGGRAACMKVRWPEHIMCG